MLRPKFVFIDGRSGATIYSESYREEVLYNAQQSTPALSSYFELMDRLVPNFLSTLEQPENPWHARAPEVTGQLYLYSPNLSKFDTRVCANLTHAISALVESPDLSPCR